MTPPPPSLVRSGRKRALVRWIVPLVVGALALSGCKRKDDDYLLGPDQDGDGWPLELDCHDRDETIFPSADDIPGDGIDQDCSGSDAEPFSFGGGGNGGNSASGGADSGGGSGGDGTGVGGDSGTVGRGTDADGDGFAAPPDGDDCDDDRLSVYPGAYEIPLNGIDENCDGSDLVGGEQLVFPLSAEAEPYEPPDIAAGMVDGEQHFLIVWSDSRSAPGQDLFGQLVDAAGNPVGGEIEIETSDADAKTDVRVASKGDGFLVTWVTVNGLSVRQLGEDGTPNGIVLGYGPAGSVDPSPAYSSSTWAVAWRTPGGDEAWVRAMTLEGARGDVLELGSGDIVSVSLTGRESGFVAGWRGPIDIDNDGILLQTRSLTGYPVGDPIDVLAGPYTEPRLSWGGGSTLMTFTVAGALSYVAGLSFDVDLNQEQVEHFRLSSESLSIQNTRLASSAGAFFATWDDGRHFGNAPSVQSIYGSAVLGIDDGVPTVPWPASRARVVDLSVELGGVAVGDEVAAIALSFDGEGALLLGSDW